MITRRQWLVRAGSGAATLALTTLAQAEEKAAGFTLPKLHYGYDALEPSIDERTMQIHHDLHHKAYVDNLNKALAGHDDLLKMPIGQLLRHLDKVPEKIRAAVRNNGGGHANHMFFWEIMGPKAGGQPSGMLAEAIDSSFGDFAKFKEAFKQAGLTRFGSGWAWLTLGADGKLKVSSTPNQDTPVMEGHHPLLGLDVWEHAYYLKYQNKRPAYIDAWWNVVNWHAVSQHFEKARAKG
jgi:Fe-Mn family superoxide dismutase